MKNTLFDNLYSCLKSAVRSLYPEIELKPDDFELLLVKDLAHGDLFTNIAFKIASALKKPVPEVARGLILAFEKAVMKDKVLSEDIAKIELKGAGFINFIVSEKYIYKVIFEILSERDKFGSHNLGKGESVQVEFVSANPTGPLSIAHGRQAAIGDALANILAFLGWKVTREYYINDEGLQIEKLGRSLWTRYRQRFGENIDLPEGGYQGTYITELAREIPDEEKNKFSKWNDETRSFFINFGTKRILEIIKGDLERFGVRFDSWVSQAALVKSGKIEEVIAILRKRDFIYEKEGALWLRSTVFGDDKDRVIVKSDKSYTYIASDIAYHRDKFERGFKKIINIWGPDHHGYIPRLKASIKALGYDAEQIKILIAQLATLYRNGQPVPMSTRAGSFITLEEVIDEVGKDVARFFFLHRKLESHLDFDLAIAKEESAENPVYYIQYANARISSIIGHAAKNDICVEFDIKNKSIDSELLKLLGSDELLLLRILMQFPFILAASASSLEPNILITYLENLAKEFHQYYTKNRVVGSEAKLTRARILVISAVSAVIKNGLRILGVSFPDKM